jgi:hypothetical protein
MSQTTAAPRQRRYTFVEQADGFRIDGGPDRVPVQVTLRPTCWAVEAQRVQSNFGLFQQHALIETAARLLMSRWQPKAGKGGRRLWQMRQWAEKQTVRGITPRIFWQVRRLLPKVDSVVLDVQRAIFAATFSTGSLALDESFYQNADRFLLSDVVRYRAAAIAVRNVCECWGNNSFHLDRHGYFTTEQALGFLSNWRGLFSPTGRPYPILNRVLMNLPGGMSHHVVCKLSGFELQRPITDRVELTLLCLGTESMHRRHEHVYQHACREQIQRAVRHVAESTHNPWSTRRTGDLRSFAMYLDDYREKHAGNVVGLADKAIRWHRAAHRQHVQQMIGFLGGDQATTLPPIPLPDEPGIRFLGRVSEIATEGQEMQHCIASYARQAVRGECFLFHVEHGAEKASVEVSASGVIRQSYGPHNRRNEAAAWGERILRRWAARFPPEFRFQQAEAAAHCLADDDIPF